MKASLTDMMSTMLMDNTEDPQQTIDDIFSNKYRKFVSLYWLLKEYSEFITKLSYKISKHDTLKIKVEISDMERDELITLLHKKAEDQNLDVDIDIRDEKLVITIRRDESMLP